MLPVALALVGLLLAAAAEVTDPVMPGKVMVTRQPKRSSNARQVNVQPWGDSMAR